MKKSITVLFLSYVLISCMDNTVVLPRSVGAFNKVTVVAKGSLWAGDVGDQIRNSFGELMVGLPQPEKTLSIGHVAPNGFTSMMRSNRNVLVIELSDKASYVKTTNKYANPQTLIYLSAKDKMSLLSSLQKHMSEIIQAFKESDIKVLQRSFYNKRVNDSMYKTLKKLNISLTIPKEFKTVDDTGDFLWLRQHLKSGIARGAGNNNILVYSLPLNDQTMSSNNIISMRDQIGEKYIPGSKQGMYMITEAAYTPRTIKTEILGNDAFETRGKWEVKNDFMAGPFLNYAIIDKKNNRLLVVEGFTYAPSVNKREFLFELEAIAKSLKIN
ncbi:DUF4837 family protein [Flavobacteriaceae bacterium]|mgnify:FL=1|jgi:hypothetical protein|nr:DUF4837 family protein [Flavobacteriaceae bacterium]MDB2685415.1 DUF4837 family protein [Flavobacteriaceae bacterium]MDC0331446.1 DUF4837 family protein [Flavobacteriaceae bacterium]MDC0636620.1 DUF4837 family protein [Flavobacteriaceae bacterium]